MSQSELERTYFQDGLHGSHCYGCGAWNDKGLRIKSFWDGDESVCIYQPEPYHAAMPPDVMNGGTIAAIIDCHGQCSAPGAATAVTMASSAAARGSRTGMPGLTGAAAAQRRRGVSANYQRRLGGVVTA